MAKQNIVSWLVIQARDSHYADIEGKCYEYPEGIPNGQRVKPGDVLVISLPQKDADQGRRLIGIGAIGSIRRAGTGHFKAHYDFYKKIDPVLAFEDVGGDPRTNTINSINKIDTRNHPDFISNILATIGVAAIEKLPPVVAQEQALTPSPVEIRDELDRAVVADLLGPANGPTEEIVGSSARDRYLVGKLAPRRVVTDAAASEDRNRGGAASPEDDSADEGATAHESLMPSSFGLTCCVDGSTEELEVRVSWGHYEKWESQSVIDKDGKPKRGWHRIPAGGKVILPLKTGPFGPLVPDEKYENVFVRGLIREKGAQGERIITLFLVNNQEEPEQNKDEAWLFQPLMQLCAKDESPVFLRKPVGGSVYSDPERASLAMLYRDHVEFAVGHGVSVHARLPAGIVDRAVEVSTQIVPTYDVPSTEIPTPTDIPGIENVVLDMKTLSELEKQALLDSLGVLSKTYESWIGERASEISKGKIAGYETSANDALDRCRRTKKRLDEGILVLGSDQDALETFRFMNKSMWHQRVHSIFSLRSRRGETVEMDQVDKPENRSWYPFQLAFILLGIPSLVDPTHADRTGGSNSTADLLWFPTGGGKTEAYLGLACFSMAIRRCQKAITGYDSERGLAVIMRYTLRLLTIQQFQRASTLICAMELLRRQEPDKWGKTPFRLGLWVGAKATPNTTKDAAEYLRNTRGQGFTRGLSNPQQLTSCPWCGREINISSMVCRPLSGDIGRTLVFCSDDYGECDFSRAKSPNEGIPVVVVDEEIYRVIPSMLIGTVDKFAQMPWKGEVQTLFGRVSGECERHGFISPDSEVDCSGNHNRHGALPRATRKTCLPLRPPDLIIQDEFHLISGPLGTMVGLYETAIDELSSWTCKEKKVYPKILASTATVRRAVEQGHNVFLRRIEVFPPHGLEVSDNFFAIRRPVTNKTPGRRYLGICAPGMSRPAVQIRVYTAFLSAAQRLFDLYGDAADPWMTLVGYFNSLRELGSMRRLVEDDVSTRTFRITLSDLERPGLAQRKIGKPEELTSRASSSDIPRILDQLEERFTTVVGGSSRPIDVVLATNMVSVGVDIQRLGLMVTNGQPKTTAEYIQATSRVGRKFPGLVCTVLNWSRPRDLSHYESFEHYHATFYQHVEAQSVTPFAPRAIDRGLTGVLASLVRLHAMDSNPNKGAGKLLATSHSLVQLARDIVSSRSGDVSQSPSTKDLVLRKIEERVDWWVREANQGGRTLGYKPEKDGTTVGLLDQPGTQPWGRFTTPTSMREVEPSVSLILKESLPGPEHAWVARKEKDSDDKEGAE